jgi:inositol 1,4,5-triphosphate receptor type 1
LNSSKFLACNFLESKHEKENYEIALEEFCSDSTLFNIVPAFKYQKDSSLVRYLIIHIKGGRQGWLV